MQFDEAKSKFINHLKSQGKATATIVAYRKDIDQLVEHLSKDGKNTFHEVTETHLNAFVERLTVQNFTPKTVSRKINSLKTFYRFLTTDGGLTTNAASNVSHPKFDTKPPRVLSKMEYRALRDACREDTRIAAIVELLLQTGMRIGELAALTLDSFQQDFLRIPTIEGHAARDIPLNRPARQSLEKYLAVRPKVKDNALFITKTGKPLLVRNMRTAIDRYFRIAGIKDAKVNDLRHTFIVHHLAAGTSPSIVSKLVGHKRMSTTERYIIISKEIDVEKVKLEEL